MQYQSNEDDDLQYRIFGESYNFPLGNGGRKKKTYLTSTRYYYIEVRKRKLSLKRDTALIMYSV
ncbi:hypothetical protein K1T71_012544 [Dendrolimus kikuchii]|uniref:Uncharacterized protein n=1 Tax=Dendrolimus kikuchii TaxID=765133 RepID=A0ACC1CJN0_9NEOP|nr:hypothetical protein K1T71_012544 [Dendrolimus kikuchii]